jgi:hypothetical protein
LDIVRRFGTVLVSKPPCGNLRRFMLRRAYPWLLLTLSVALLAGCKGNCRKLSERLCDCQPSTIAKDDCNRRASAEESRLGTKPADEALCAQLLKTCDCHTIDTPEGKRSCGLARTPP